MSTSITDTTLTEIQHFLVKHVKASSEFDTLCNSILGSSLNYYRGADLSKFSETLPYMTSYKFNSQDNEGQDAEWIVQYIIGIESDEEPVVDADNITVYESTDKVEQLATKALDIIHEGIRDGSLSNTCQLRIVSENIIITEVGEAKDVQAIVTLRLEDYSTF